MKFIFNIFLFYGCTTLGQSTLALNPNAVIKKTMALSVNGKAGIGFISVPMADTYRLDLDFPAKPEIVKIATCHREIIIEKPTTKTFFVGSIKGLENDGLCQIHVDALDLGGVNSSAIIEIENEKLDGAVICNGESRHVLGVSVCQGKVGLTQRILFFEPVEFEKMAPDCADMIPMAQLGFGYDFDISKGYCTYLFHGKKSDTFHRLSTYGYDDIFLNSIKPKNQ